MRASPIGLGKGKTNPSFRSAPVSLASRAPSGHGDDDEPTVGAVAAAMRHWESGLTPEGIAQFRRNYLHWQEQVSAFHMLSSGHGYLPGAPIAIPPGLIGAAHSETAGSHLREPETVTTSRVHQMRTGGGSESGSPSIADSQVAGVRVLGLETATTSPDPTAQPSVLAANPDTLAVMTNTGHGDSEELNDSRRGSHPPEGASAVSAGTVPAVVHDQSRSAKESPMGSVSGRSDGRLPEEPTATTSAPQAVNRLTSPSASPLVSSPQPRARESFDISSRRSSPSMHRTKSMETLDRIEKI